MNWLPLGYLTRGGLDGKTAEQHAAEILSLTPIEKLEQTMGTDIAAVQKHFDKALETITDAAASYATAMVESNGNDMKKTLARSVAIATIEESLTDELLKVAVLPLMGKKIGFKTDRDTGGQKPYPLSTLRSAVCEVLLHGGRIDGNEFCVISGGAYLTQNFWRRKVEEDESIADVEIQTGEVEVRGRDGLVEVVATWTVDGEPREWIKTKRRLKGREFDGRLVVPVNNAMGRDAILGKVLARTYKAIYTLSAASYLSSAAAEGEEHDEEVIDVEAAHAQAGDNPAEDPQDVADQQTALIAEYERKLADCDQKTHVGQVAKQAGQDDRLTPESKRVVSGMCTERRKAL